MSESDFDRVKRILSLVNVDPGVCPPEDATCQPHTFLKQAALSSGADIYKASDNAEVSQWLSLSRGLCESTSKKATLLNQLNTSLERSSYLLPSAAKYGLADLAVFDAVQQPNVAAECRDFRNLCRWVRLMSDLLCIPLKFDIPVGPTLFNLESFAPLKGDDSTPRKDGVEEAKGETEKKKVIPPMSEKQIAKQKEKAAKKEKASKKGNEAPQEKSDNDLDPSKLDFRVGHVLKCWPHPTAEKLLCEEIDMGNGEVRQIASGLKEFYSPEEVQGRLVIVLCNLKDRKMLDFNSQGMVICSSNTDHSAVKLLEPPTGSKPGDWVSFPGYGLEEEQVDGGKRREPASSSQVAKKKILEKLSPGLKTDSNGTAMWESSPFTIGTQGTVGSALPNGLVG